jgi:hypothetical protein
MTVAALLVTGVMTIREAPAVPRGPVHFAKAACRQEAPKRCGAEFPSTPCFAHRSTSYLLGRKSLNPDGNPADRGEVGDDRAGVDLTTPRFNSVVEDERAQPRPAVVLHLCHDSRLRQQPVVDAEAGGRRVS